MADFDAQLPVRSTALEFTTEVANAAGTTINPAEDFAQGSTTAGQNGVLDQGAVTTSAPTYITGTTNPLSLDTAGNLRVSSTVTNFPALQNVNITDIGGNPVTTTIPVSGTVAVTQSTSPWVVSLASTTITGTVTVAGNLTNNNAAPTADNIGALIAVANAAHPTWTEGDQVLLSEDLSANLRTKDFADGSAAPGTAATVSMLTGGIFNSTPPTVTNGQQVSLQVDANGRLLVDTNTSASVTPVLTYFTDSSVAQNASVTHSLAGPVVLDEIDFAGSGEIKATVAIGVTGSEVTYWNGFNSAAGQELKWKMPFFGYVIPAGSSAKITILNRDKQAQDTYVTFFSH
jgi:hypothetical protein